MNEQALRRETKGVRLLLNTPYTPRGPICHKFVVYQALCFIVPICNSREQFMHKVRVRISFVIQSQYVVGITIPIMLSQQAIGPHEDLLTIVKRRKLQWYGHVSRSAGLAKTILQGTMTGGRRQGGQRKRWEDNIREWIGLEFGKSQRAKEKREK